LTERRHVRFAVSFFDDLDEQLGHDRGPNGEPSTRDFQSIELLEIAERFATGFESLHPLFDERDDYRVLVKSGLLVGAMQVIGQETSDGSIEIVEIDIDLQMDWD